jgi:transposase
MTQPLLPDLPGFSIEQITLTDGVITVLAQSHTMQASCPACASQSSRIHSRYERTLSDLPWSGRIVRLVVQVRRFLCLKPTCPRKTFAEAIPAVAERYARRTIRLKEVLERLALALGGEQGSRLAAVLRMRWSPDTLLRLLRRLPDDPVDPPRVVSLDDWAWRRGHRYGTLICDLERHRRLDILPDRDAASVAAWLKRYPSIEIISRDRSDTYATAARLGAPQALQVTDRWHLLVRRIGATYIPFGERRGREHTTSGTVADLARKLKGDSSMPQRWGERKALMFVPMCPARHGETTLSNLVSSGESHTRRGR